jgi:hypothetical protein
MGFIRALNNRALTVSYGIPGISAVSAMVKPSIVIYIGKFIKKATIPSPAGHSVKTRENKKKL